MLKMCQRRSEKDTRLLNRPLVRMLQPRQMRRSKLHGPFSLKVNLVLGNIVAVTCKSRRTRLGHHQTLRSEVREALISVSTFLLQLYLESPTLRLSLLAFSMVFTLTVLSMVSRCPCAISQSSRGQDKFRKLRI